MAIEAFIAEYKYAPNVGELQAALAKLHELVDRQTRGLIELAIVASQPYIAGLSATPTTVV